MDLFHISPISLNNQDLLLHETLFHSANGYLGVRGDFEEGYAPGMQSVRGLYINGFYDIAPMPQAEPLYGLVNEKQTTLNIADVQGCQIEIEGEAFSLFSGTLLESDRSLNMAKGVSVRRALWRSPLGHTVEIAITRMASFVRPSLFTMDFSITPQNFSGEIIFRSIHSGDVRNFADPNDPRLASSSHQHLFVDEASCENGVSKVVAHTARSGQKVCTLVRHTLNSTAKVSLTGVTHVIRAALTQGQTLRMVKHVSVGDTVHHGEQFIVAAENALVGEIDQLYQEQAQYLQLFFKTAQVEIQGDEALNRALKYNLYQLLQSVTKDASGNMAAKGLSGEGYEGHYFWDTEMYLQPFFLLTKPELCRNLIAFRYKTLPAARENARLLGHKEGALYPWRTIMGTECSGYFVSGTAAYHINGAVGYSIAQYYLATEDDAFMKKMGAEMLLEIARLWLDVGSWYNGQFHINCVTGPDEYTCMVNNNYYTNLLARHNLRWAARFNPEHARAFLEAAEKMVLPYDPQLDINPQDDSFLQKAKWDFDAVPKENHPLLLHYHPLHLYRYQVCKQADTVLAYFVDEDAQAEQTMANSYAYYEAITTHDSSLSSCIFSIMAARLGEVEKAYHYFGDSAKMDLENTHHNTKDGIHTANMGGSFMAIVYGFGGLRLKEDGLHLRPSLPKEWSEYTFRITYRGSLIEVTVNGSGCHLALLSGDKQTIFVNGKAMTIEL